jgi:hypothetical protein
MGDGGIFPTRNFLGQWKINVNPHPNGGGLQVLQQKKREEQQAYYLPFFENFLHVFIVAKNPDNVKPGPNDGLLPLSPAAAPTGRVSLRKSPKMMTESVKTVVGAGGLDPRKRS